MVLNRVIEKLMLVIYLFGTNWVSTDFLLLCSFVNTHFANMCCVFNAMGIKWAFAVFLKSNEFCKNQVFFLMKNAHQIKTLWMLCYNVIIFQTCLQWYNHGYKLVPIRYPITQKETCEWNWESKLALSTTWD